MNSIDNCKIKKFHIFLIANLFFRISPSTTQAENKPGLCTLTQKSSQDPFPSLSKCYKYNNEACCMSVHDEYISDYLSSLLPTSCLRKYGELEDLMCLACHPLESLYVNNETKVINICKNFAMTLWNATNDEELNKPSEIFDNCGFKPSNYTSLGRKYIHKKFILPSQIFSSFHDFIKNVTIPFYEDYSITLQEETNDFCYNYGNFIGNYNYFFVLVMVICIIL